MKKIKLIVTRDTFFKLSPIPSAELSDAEKVSVEAGTEFNVHSYKDMGNHVKVAFLGAELKGRNTWIAYEGHIELVDENGVKLPGFNNYKPGDRLPEKIDLLVPWFGQRDNKFKPFGTCNVTCVAMCLYFYGIRPKRAGEQLEDELFKSVSNKGWDRHVHDHLRRLCLEYGIHDRFKVDASWDEVKLHLANGNPVIYSGKLTHSGHIIVLRGYDATGFWVNDPFGEFFNSGYQNKSGDNLHYSYGLLQQKSMTGNAKTTWAHFPEKR